MSRRVALVAVVTAVAVAAVGVLAGSPGEGQVAMPSPVAEPIVSPWVSSPDDPVPQGTPSAIEAAGLLRTLPRAEPMDEEPPYDRSEFGGWQDPDRNGCDGREDAVAQWLRHPIDCTLPTVASEVIVDPYSGHGLDVSRSMDIDHVVPLREAWRSGAYRWSRDKRVAFANDPGHLIPVGASVNRAKSDRDAASWLPPQYSYWCEYARVYIAAKHAYSLTVDTTEAEALDGALGSCAPSAMSSDPGYIPPSGPILDLVG